MRLARRAAAKIATSVGYACKMCGREYEDSPDEWSRFNSCPDCGCDLHENENGGYHCKGCGQDFDYHPTEGCVSCGADHSSIKPNNLGVSNDEEEEFDENELDEGDQKEASGNDGFVTDRDSNPEKLASGNDAFVTDRDSNPEKVASGNDGFVTDRDGKTEKLASALKMAAPAAPAVPAPAPAPAPEAPADPMDFASWSTEALTATIKALTGLKELESDQAAKAVLARMTEEYQKRPGPAPEQQQAVTASWSAQSKNNGDVEEGTKVPEVSQAHNAEEDNTGIKRPATVDPAKFASQKTAGEMATGTAINKAESIADKLKAMYLDAKQINGANDSAPVKRAVESIYAAFSLFGEAIKVLQQKA
jgi:hypothetical protein